MLQRAFGRWNRTASARIEFNRHTQRTRECFKYRLTLVMRIITAQIINMDRYQCMIDKTLEKFVH